MTMLKKILCISTVFVFALSSCKARKEAASATLDSESKDGSGVLFVNSEKRGIAWLYFDVDAMVQAGKNRFEVYELQNYFNDIGTGLVKVESGIQTFADVANFATNHPRAPESGYSEIDFKSGPLGKYVVVVDLDETLLRHLSGAQSNSNYPGYEGLSSITVDNQPNPENRDSSIVFRKGVKEFFAKLREDPNCAGIVLFTAKADLAAADLRAKWNPQVDGYFTRHYLQLDAAQKLKQASKDLKIFDETLQHVVLVDDNPARVYSQFNLITPEQFKVDQNAGLNPKTLSDIADEIIAAGNCANKKNIPFSEALKPYSYAIIGIHGTRAAVPLCP